MFRDVLKTLPQYLIPKHGITALAGYFADVKNPRLKNFLIRNFIRKFDVDMSEALIEDPKSYDCFNDFFIRHLKPESRPLSQSDVICPVDGCISEIGKIERGQLLQAKGKYYSVQELLACDGQLAEQFVQGQFATLYLSPKDYHRVHMPIDAELVSMTYIPGALFSVQPATTRVVPKLFARNERLAIFFKTKIGPMVMVMVGATIVGAIGTSWHGDVKRSKKLERFDYSEQFPDKIISQGSEMGYFKLGSTVVLLFANGEKIQWDKELLAGSKIQLGKPMAIIT